MLQPLVASVTEADSVKVSLSLARKTVPEAVVLRERCKTQGLCFVFFFYPFMGGKLFSTPPPLSRFYKCHIFSVRALGRLVVLVLEEEC